MRSTFAHGLAVTLPCTDNKRLVRRRMVANGVDGNLLLVCGAIAVENRLIILLSLPLVGL